MSKNITLKINNAKETVETVKFQTAVVVGCTVWAFIWGTGGIISLVLLSMAWEYSPTMTTAGLAVMAAAVASFFLFGRGGQPSKRRDAPLSADCAREP